MSQFVVKSLRRTCLTGLALLVLAVGGCATSEPPPVTPPPAVLTSTAAPGSVLSGPVGNVPAFLKAVNSDFRRVDVEWFALKQMPAGALAPIDAHATLTMAPGASVIPSGQATRQVRIGWREDADSFIQSTLSNKDQSISLGKPTAMVTAGTTRRFRAATVAQWPAQLDIDISPFIPPSGRPQMMLAVAVAGPETSGTRETAVIQSLPFESDIRYVVVAPMVFPGTPWKAVAAVVTLWRADDTPDERQRFQAELQQSIDASKAGLPADGQNLAGALASLATSRSPRASLLYLATLSHATIAADYILAADSKAIDKLAADTADFAKPAAPPAMPDLQWFLDRTTMQAMCAGSEKDPLRPELASVLAMHAGDLSRRIDVIVELLKGVRSSDELDQRVIAENTIALEDSSPAVRVRAYDWLVSRNKAPAGFDPLADAKTRRAAMDKIANP